MLLRFTQAARKHKIGKFRVRHVIENPVVVFQIPAEDEQSDNRTLYLGDDETGRALEVLTVRSRAVNSSSTPWISAPSTGPRTTPRRRRPAMTDETPEADYDPRTDAPLHDTVGNLIDDDYVNALSHEAETGYDLDQLTPTRVGRPSLSDTGDSPQVRFRLPADTRAEAAALAASEGKTLSQLARDALEAYLTAHRST